MYRETKIVRYLHQAQNIADFLIDHPNLPEDKIPYWDYYAPGIPDAKRDASVGAIMASALIKLSGLSGGKKAKNIYWLLKNRYVAWPLLHTWQNWERTAISS